MKDICPQRLLVSLYWPLNLGERALFRVDMLHAAATKTFTDLMQKNVTDVSLSHIKFLSFSNRIEHIFFPAQRQINNKEL